MTKTMSFKSKLAICWLVALLCAFVIGVQPSWAETAQLTGQSDPVEQVDATDGEDAEKAEQPETQQPADDAEKTETVETVATETAQDDTSAQVEMAAADENETLLQPAQSANMTAMSDPEFADGTYIIRSLVGTRTVLDVAGAGTGNGTNVQLYEYNGTDAQKWNLAYDAATKLYTITSVVANKVLDVAGAGTGNGTNVQIYESNGTKAQQWRIVKDGDGWRIESALKDSGYTLDIAGASSSNGTNAWCYAANGTVAQRFDIMSTNPTVAASTATVTEGAYTITAGTGKVLDIAGGSRDSGANAQQYASNSTYAQRFYIESDGSGFYRVFSVGSGLALDVAGADLLPGGNVQQYSYNGTNAQLWSLQKNSDGTITFLSKANGLALDIAGASSNNCANLQVYTSNSTKAQKFTLTAIDLLSAGTVSLYSSASVGRATDVKGGVTTADTALQIYDYNGSSAQKLIVAKSGSGYTLRSVCSGLYASPSGSNVVQSSTKTAWTVSFAKSGSRRGIMLTTSGKALAASGTGNASALALATVANDAKQYFLPAPVELIDNGIYTIANIASDKVLDIAGGSWQDGANVQIYTGNNTGAQAWRFESLGNGYYRITNAMTGRALDVKDGKAADGANVQQWSRHSADAQIWKAEFVDAGYFVFTNKAANRVLDVAGGSTKDGANVDVWTANSTVAQGWRINQASYTPDAVLQNALNRINGKSSSSQYFIAVDRANTRVMVFQGSQGNWTPIQNYVCSCGRDETPTITGDYYVGIKGYSFGDSDHTCYWYTQISGDYLFHSVLYYPGTMNVKDGRLGYHISMGCVRLDINNAKWIYDNVPSGTHIYIYN